MRSAFFSVVFLASAAAAHAVIGAQAIIIDRVAVTVGKDVITESEVTQEIRLTDFQNQAPLDFSPTARRTAAERLVDQYLLRNEMRLEGFAEPKLAAAAQALRQFRQAHFRTVAQYQAALKKYGISEEELEQHLLWQIAAVSFARQRFGSGASSNSATDGHSDTTEQQLDAWLKQTRSQTRIEFHQEAFQ
jgi:SurA N-terminal domain